MRGVGGELPQAQPGQHPFAPTQLGLQAAQRPGRLIGAEVGDDAEHVREPGRVRERRPALVVHQQQDEAVRRR